MIKRLLKSNWTYTTIHVVGFSLLGGYLVLTNDWRISIPWALAFPTIAFSVGWLMASLELHQRFPKLNQYILYPSSEQSTQASLTEEEWVIGMAEYHEKGMRGTSILFAPSEDGLVGVPVLLAGLGFVSSGIGGIVFGLLHLGRFTYLECIGKGIYYSLVCLVVLPHGLLSLVLGHLLTDFLGLIAIKAVKQRVSNN